MQIADATAGALEASGVIPTAEPLPSVYSFEKLPDGRIRVPNVPIFAEHERDLGDGKKFKADLPWLSRMVTNMRRRESENYSPALHLGHHDPRTTDERPSVGIFRNPRLKLSLYEDKPAWVAFADFVLDSERDLKALRKHRYRSVEIKNVQGEPKIDGVALLQSRSPYFKFPNMELAASEEATAPLAYESVNGVGGVFHWPAPLKFADENRITEYAAPGAIPGQQQQTTAAPGDIGAKIDQLTLLVKQLIAVFNPSQPQGTAQPVMQAAEPERAPLHSEDVMDATKREKLAKKLAKIQEALKTSQKPTATMTYAEGVALEASHKQLAKKQKKIAKKLAEAANETPTTATTGSYAEAAPKPAAAPAAPAPAPKVETVVAFAAKAAAAAGEAKKIRDEALTWAEGELKDRPTGDRKELLALLEAQYSEAGRAGLESAVSVIKSMLPSLPGPTAHPDASLKAPKAGPAGDLEVRYSDDAVALDVINETKLFWEHRPAKYRNDSLESFVNADPRMDGRIRPASAGSK